MSANSAGHAFTVIYSTKTPWFKRNTILYCTVLYCTVLHYTTLHYTILYYTILYYTIHDYTLLYITIHYYTLLYHTMYIYIYMYTYTHRYSLQGGAVGGGCSGRGVQWMGVVLHSKLVYNTIQITTPCFHCTPLR